MACGCVNNVGGYSGRLCKLKDYNLLLFHSYSLQEEVHGENYSQRYIWKGNSYSTSAESLAMNWVWTNKDKSQGANQWATLIDSANILLCAFLYSFTPSLWPRNGDHVTFSIRRNGSRVKLMVTELSCRGWQHSEKMWSLHLRDRLTPFFRGDIEWQCWRWTGCPNKLLHHKAVIK